MASKVNDMDMCPVCFEDYEEEGNHVPRRLPCTHTFCEDCITLLVGNNKTFRCPECRTFLTASAGTKHFLKNKEILLHLKESRDVSETMYREDQELPCPTHGESMNLFCNEPVCQLQICSECLFDEHSKHHVVELQSLKNESCETLRSYLGYLHKSLILKREQHFLKYKQFRSANNHGKFMKTAARIAHLNDIRKDMTATLSYQDISNHIQTVRDMASTFQISLPDFAERYYHSYHDPEVKNLQEEPEHEYIPMDTYQTTPISKKEESQIRNRSHPWNALGQEQREIGKPKEESDNLYLPMGAFQTVLTPTQKRSPYLSRKHQGGNQNRTELADEFSTLNISPNRRTNIYGNFVYTVPKTQEKRSSVAVQSLNELLRESAKDLERLDQEFYIPEQRSGDTNKQGSFNFPINNFSPQKQTEMSSEEEPYMTMDAILQEVAPTKTGRKVRILDDSGISFGIPNVKQIHTKETKSYRRRYLNQSENPVNRNLEEQYVNLHQLTRQDPNQKNSCTSIDPKYGHVMRELDCAVENIQETKTKLLSLKEMSESKFSICQAKLKTDKEETLRNITQMVNELYGELEKEISDEKQKVTSNIDDDIATLDENNGVMDDLRTNIMSGTKTDEDLDNMTEMVDNMVEQIKLNLQKKKSYSYPEYCNGELARDHIQKFVGVLTTKEIKFPCFDENIENSNQEDEMYDPNFYV